MSRLSAGPFVLLDSGWWRAPVKPAVIEKAKATCASRNEAAGRTKRWDSPMDYCGEVGEIGVRAWLELMKVPFVSHGGLDRKPDLEVHGTGVSVKTSHHTTTFQPHFWIPYPKSQADRSPHAEVLALVYRVEPAELTVIGGMTMPDFLAKAELVRKGDVMESGREASWDFYRCRASDFPDPIEWLCRIELAAAALVR